MVASETIIVILLLLIMIRRRMMTKIMQASKLTFVAPRRLKILAAN